MARWTWLLALVFVCPLSPGAYTSGFEPVPASSIAGGVAPAGDKLQEPLGLTASYFLTPTLAQAPPKAAPAPSGGAGKAAAVSAGIGFTSNPGMFLMNYQLDHRFEKGLSVGPRLQLGYGDEETLFAPTLNLTFHPELQGANLGTLKPFLQGGVGAAYLEKSDRRGDDDEWGFLFDFGGGVDVPISDVASVRSDVLLNFLPGSPVGEGFYFSWTVVSVSFAF